MKIDFPLIINFPFSFFPLKNLIFIIIIRVYYYKQNFNSIVKPLNKNEMVLPNFLIIWYGIRVSIQYLINH